MKVYKAISLMCLLAVSALAADPSPAESSPGSVTAPASGPSLQGVPASGDTASGTAPAINGFIADESYKLRPGDKLSFQILEDRKFDDKDVPRALLVSDSGELDVPYIGRVLAANKTCKQVVEEIKAALEKDFYKTATVVLALDAANKYLGRVYVWGQVRNQGPIDVALNEKITAGKAILRAGGFGDFANKKKVKVIRASSEGASKQTFELNMVEILEEGKTEKDIQLQPDDYILVPSRLINF